MSSFKAYSINFVIFNKKNLQSNTIFIIFIRSYNMEEIKQNDNKIRNRKYTYEQLGQYLNIYSKLFIGPEKEEIDGVKIKNYSNEAKKVWTKMQSVQSEIHKMREIKGKELKKARTEWLNAQQDALRKYRKQNPKGQSGLEFVKNDPDVIKYRKKMSDTTKEIEDAESKAKQEFMEWEEKNCKDNIIIRNNDIVSLAQGTKAMLGYNPLSIDQADEINSITLKNDKQQQLPGNLAHITASMIELLNEKSGKATNEEEKGKLQQMIYNIVQAVQEFFGISTTNGDAIKDKKAQIENLLNQAVKECLKGNIQEINKYMPNKTPVAPNVKKNSKNEEIQTNKDKTTNNIEQNTSVLSNSNGTTNTTILDKSTTTTIQSGNANNMSFSVSDDINIEKLLEKKGEEVEAKINEYNSLKEAIEQSINKSNSQLNNQISTNQSNSQLNNQNSTINNKSTISITSVNEANNSNHNTPIVGTSKNNDKELGM